MSIPKIIHYCWFGKKPKGKLIEECIESWKQYLPGYKLVEWNEDTYSSDSFFFNECLAQKKYAFASDYVRFDVLKKQGGIYMDTDMLLLKSLDPLLKDDCFFGYEYENIISCGVIGAIAGEPFIANIQQTLAGVNNMAFFENYTIVKQVNELFAKWKSERSHQLPVIHPIDYFYPYPFAAGGDPMSYKTNNTIAIHLWNASWFNDYNKALLLFSQGKKAAARKLFCKSLLRHPQYIRFAGKFF